VILRAAKALLVLAIALYYTVIVLNNTTDYDSNFQFIRHVLMMDSTFPNNSAMWRAVNSPSIHTLFYITIIAWESLTMILCWWGGINLARNLKASAAAFHESKNIAIAGLTLSMLMWFVAFLTIGAEWFMMWQSQTWNGQEAAFRMFTVVGIVLLLVSMKDDELQNSPTNS
jgi:predicted small integral membrane protein